MNSIWLCKVKLIKKRRPKQSLRVKMPFDYLDSLVIIDGSGNYAELKTNQMVLGNRIRNSFGNNYTVEDIESICLIKYLGNSLATY